MKKITLSGKYGEGKTVKVDDELFTELSKTRWQTSPSGYAYRMRKRLGKSRIEYMHRLILKPKDGLETDHIDRDKLNNQRHNLREVTKFENHRNRGANKNNSLGVKNVRLDGKTFYVRMMIRGITYIGPRAETIKEAFEKFEEGSKIYTFK